MNYFLSLLASGVVEQEPLFLDWQWLLIFIVVVIILILALIDNTVMEDEHAVEVHHDDVHEEVELHAEPETEPEPVEAAAAAPVKPDDLKKIEGIGPKVASLLAEAGMTTFAALAAAEVGQLEAILEANKLQMMDPTSWPEQARLAAAGEWDALEALQDDLKGGRAGG